MVEKIVLGIASNEIRRILQALRFPEEEIDEFRQRLHESTLSVDAFLEHRTEFTKIGKAAIASALIQCETHDVLFERAPNGQPNWYRYLFRLLNPSYDDFSSNRLCIITFNYDRSLEHFLFTALQSIYKRRIEEIAEKVAAIEIVHVHGTLGVLPWQASIEGQKIRSYKKSDLPADVSVAAANIKIVSDDIDDDPEFKRAHELILNSERVFFLGFGYHPDNMRRLRVPLQEGDIGYDGHRKIVGTCFGATQRERQYWQREPLKGISLDEEQYTIYDLMRNNQWFLRITEDT